MLIDPKNLIPLPVKDWKPGGIFYRKESEDDYAMCVAPTVEEMEKMSIWEQCEYREMTKKFLAEGRLFVNRNRPFESFV